MNETFRNMQSSGVEVAEVPVFAAPKSKKKKVAVGSVVEYPLAGGKSRKVELMRIVADQVEKKTTVWLHNEREQELLTETALDDIVPSMRGDDGEQPGQRTPAVGRMVNGVIEVADGSRRRMGTILAEQDFLCWVGDFTDEEMDDLTEVGNFYRPPSEWEKARNLARRVKNQFDGNQSQAEKGLKKSRRTIGRALKIATIPIEIVKAFASPNDMSGKKALRIADAWGKASKKATQACLEQCINGLYVPPTDDMELAAELITQRVESILTGTELKEKAPTESKGSKKPASKHKLAFNEKKGTANIVLKDLPGNVIGKAKAAIENLLADHYATGWYSDIEHDLNETKFDAMVQTIMTTRAVLEGEEGIELDGETWFNVSRSTIEAALFLDMSNDQIISHMKSELSEYVDNVGNDKQESGEYPYYSGDRDPRLSEPTNQDDVDTYEHVECSNGCGFWAGQLIEEGQCPECGSECHAIADDYFD